MQRSIVILALLFHSIFASAAEYEEFKVPTTDGKSLLTGQIDLPPAKCGAGPHKAVMIVSGSGWSYRDGFMGRSGSDGDSIYRFMAKSLQDKCYLVVRWDYRGVSCDRKQPSDVQKCIDQKVRAEMDHNSMLEDILAVYKFAESFPLLDKSEFKIIGHSEGSLNVASLIYQNRILPKGVLFMGALTESPKDIFYWQAVLRKIEWLFELDKDG
ncbi:MAG TPA: hypothetical protein PLJ21_09980, partial [Pseudobdellovibrionaceae bacterium]|nr:hypothetical protein [Pseudobdellovibrionaceae bacterium]